MNRSGMYKTLSRCPVTMQCCCSNFLSTWCAYTTKCYHWYWHSM